MQQPEQAAEVVPADLLGGRGGPGRGVPDPAAGGRTAAGGPWPAASERRDAGTTGLGRDRTPGQTRPVAAARRRDSASTLAATSRTTPVTM